MTTPQTSVSYPADYTELLARLATVHDLHAASAVLGWDQMTYLPAGSGGPRGRHLATLTRLAHEHFTDDRIGVLLNNLSSFEASLPGDSDEASLLRIARQDHGRAVRVPGSFMATFAEHQSASYQAWTVARPANDWKAVTPILERTVELSREYASFFPRTNHLADVFVDEAEPGLDVEAVRALFSSLRARLVPMVRQIVAQARPDDTFLTRVFPVDTQWQFGEMIARKLGYDFERGRQDRAPHPFTTSFGRNDVRITTRLSETDLRFGLFATMHEAGHGMYEQGVAPSLDGTLLGSGASSGVHESQSRLWENVVGRSRGFWKWGYSRLQSTFPGQLGDVSADQFYRAINRVEPSLIRVEADEMTYNLHIMMRFDFELALLDGSLRVVDLPDAWNARFKDDLGITPATNQDGCMQDVHWFASPIAGQFQGYTIGNVLSAQCFDRACEVHPSIPSEIEGGEFGSLLAWLQTNLHALGRKYDVNDTVVRATGRALTIEPYLAYLKAKFGDLYDLS